MAAGASPLQGDKGNLAGLAAKILAKHQMLGEGGAPPTVVVGAGWKELRGMCSDFNSLLEGKTKGAAKEHLGVHTLCKALVASTVTARNKDHAKELQNLDYLRVGREPRVQAEATAMFDGAVERASKSVVKSSAASVKTAAKAARWRLDMLNAKSKCSELASKASAAKSKTKKADLLTEAKSNCDEAKGYEVREKKANALAGASAAKAKSAEGAQKLVTKSNYHQYMPKISNNAEKKVDKALKDLGLKKEGNGGKTGRGASSSQGITSGRSQSGAVAGTTTGKVGSKRVKVVKPMKAGESGANRKMKASEKAAKATLKHDLKTVDKKLGIKKGMGIKGFGPAFTKGTGGGGKRGITTGQVSKGTKSELSAWVPRTRPGSAVMLNGASVGSQGRKGPAANGALRREGFSTGRKGQSAAAAKGAKESVLDAAGKPAK